MDIESLLKDMASRETTDLYLSAGNPPIFRNNGTLYPADGVPALTPQEVQALVEPYLTPGQKQAAWGSSGVRQVGIRRSDVAVEGEIFPDGDCLAAAFHRVL